MENDAKQRHDDSDSIAGNDINAGNAGTPGKRSTITLDQARELALGAKMATGHRHAWDQHDPDAKPSPKERFSVGFNDYDRALIRAVAMWRDLSMNQTIVQLVREAALAEVKRRERPKRVG